ncbi:MAG: hypothetical protein IJP92_06640 [Lachnospiraceae bacterium]|nr:hypothetical protein [Lachnospiraceae bacterium]
MKDVLRTLSAMKGFEECIPAMHRIIGRLYDEGTMYRKMGDALRIVSDFYIDCDRRTSELRASAGIRISTGTSTQQIVGVIEQPQIGSTAWQHLEALASVIQ